MNIIIGSTTTARDVLSKVLEKCRVSDPLESYQLWAVSKDKSQKQLQGLCSINLIMYMHIHVSNRITLN